MSEKLNLFDNTRLVSFKKCPRDFYFRHVRNWTVESKATPLIFGSAWHESMDHIWQNHADLYTTKASKSAVIEGAYQAFIGKWTEYGMSHPDEMSPDDIDQLTPRTPMIALEMLYEYVDAREYIFTDKSFSLVAVEEPFAVPLDPNRPDLWYVGRLDKTFRLRRDILIGEHKCLGAGTPILKFDGSVVPVESLVKGDFLMGPDSKPRKIISTCTGVDELYRITPVKGDPYIVNKNHILSLKMTPSGQNLRCGGKIFKSGEIANVTVADYLLAKASFRDQAKGWRVGVTFNRIDQHHPHLPPYILGVWLGDGNSANQGITAIEPEIVQEIRDYAVYRDLKITTQGKNNSRTHFLSIGKDKFRANPLLDALKSFNLIENKHIPLFYKACSRQARLELLAGIIDTDGNAQHNGYRITQKNKVLAEDICYVARSLGLAAYMPKHTGTCTNNGKMGEYFYIYISGDCSDIPVRVPRKRVDARKQIKNVCVTGFTIEAVGPGRYYGFELEGPDRLFLLGDFTVTHNTSTSYKINGPFRNDFIDSFSMSSQCDGYLFASRMLYGEEASAVWIDAALVHKKIHDGFKFIPIDRQTSQLDAWLYETHFWIDQIEANKAVLQERAALDTPYLAAFPKNTNSCTQYGRCAFMDICTAVANPAKLDGPPLGYKEEKWSPFDTINLSKLGFTADG